jgi:CheY-like chemotaxis protein
MATTILIVDDSKLARIVLGKAIAAHHADWNRVEAGNAEEAKALIQAGGIDLAILDFNMPGENGLDLAETLKAQHPDMPIALATANVQDELIARARTIGATFIAKPITEDGVKGFLSGAALKLRKAAGG